MESITLEDLINNIRSYNDEEVEIIKKAYYYAANLHAGQYRQSGEPYIIHPLNVAFILSQMHADRDTVIAGLLHDTLEDTSATLEDIRDEFNDTVAHLVDGVTKLSKMNFSSKQERYAANTRKIITSITDDVRIIIIKLADRLHNMRTLEFKSHAKQKENALETLEIFVPLAYYIGAYDLKSELEDLSLKYLKPDEYQRVSEKRALIETEYEDILKEMLENINYLLKQNKVPHEIKTRLKNIYGIYKSLIGGLKLKDIHDLVALKIMVETVSDCYRTLGLVHQIYHPINYEFKDYICNPKPNIYQSLHSNLYVPSNHIVQAQIRTFDMDKIASVGLTAYWDKLKGKARDAMQEDLRTKFKFFKTLTEIDEAFLDNADFVSQVKKELLSGTICVYTSSGKSIEMPSGSTAIDFAYSLSTDIGDTMVGAVINGKTMPADTVLQNGDYIKIITDALSFGPKKGWVDKVITTAAHKELIKFNRKN